jgi:hypothetical protein
MMEKWRNGIYSPQPIAFSVLFSNKRILDFDAWS